MPAKGLKKRDTEFMVVLEELQVILETYRSSHSLIIGGDWNASFLHPRDARDRLLVTFVKQQSLVLSRDHPDTPTYVTADGMERSSIDYNFTTSEITTLKTQVIDSPLNTSDHRAVSTTVLVKYNTKNTQEKTPTKPRSWLKTDVELYSQLAEEGIQRLKVESIMSEFELQSAIDKLINTLVTAKDISTPNRKISRSGFKTLTAGFIWSDH